MRSFLAKASSVVAVRSGYKLTQKDNADGGVRFITPGGPRQSLLLAKDPDHFLGKLYIPEADVHKPTSPNSLTIKVNLLIHMPQS